MHLLYVPLFLFWLCVVCFHYSRSRSSLCQPEWWMPRCRTIISLMKNWWLLIATPLAAPWTRQSRYVFFYLHYFLFVFCYSLLFAVRVVGMSDAFTNPTSFYEKKFVSMHINWHFPFLMNYIEFNILFHYLHSTHRCCRKGQAMRYWVALSAILDPICWCRLKTTEAC